MDNIQERYKAGCRNRKIVRLVDFGALELEPGVEGLVHVSQIAYTHVESRRMLGRPNGGGKVLDVKPDERRISPRIKETTENPAGNSIRSHRQQAHTEDHPPITIGELGGDIFKEE